MFKEKYKKILNKLRKWTRKADITKIKETTVKQWIDEETGMTMVELNCSICGYCPCKHTQLDFDGVKIKSLPKIPKDPKRAKIRGNLTLN